MNYLDCQSYHSLTHWQSNRGKETSPITKIPREYNLIGIKKDGQNIFFPLYLSDGFSTLLDPSVSGISSWYGWKAPETLTCQSNGKWTGDKTEYAGISYQGRYTGELHTLTKYGASDALEFSYIENGETKTGKYEKGKEYDVLLPIYDIYFLVEATATKGYESELPEWIQNFEEKTGQKKPAQKLDTSIWTPVKIEEKYTLLQGVQTSNNRMFGGGARTGVTQDKSCFSGCYQGYMPFSSGAANAVTSTLGGGSIVGNDLNLYLQTARIGTFQLRNYYGVIGNNAKYYIYITRELRGLTTTKGVVYDG
jgi:hypothetical protein